MTETAKTLRQRAKHLLDEAYKLEGNALKGHERFIVVESIQDGRPRASGPFTWDEAVAASKGWPGRYICDYGGLLP